MKTQTTVDAVNLPKTRGNGRAALGNEVTRPRGATPQQAVFIPPPNLQTVEFKIIGTSPYMQHRFSEKAMKMMMDKQRLGDQAKKGKKREARDFDADFKAAQHISTEGWNGIPCAAIRSAIIDACRLVAFKMTVAKVSIFVVADGEDRVDGAPLTKIFGTPTKHTAAVRNETGVADIRCRPMWKTWHCNLKVQFDGDLFSVSDVTHLLARAGAQVGIGEGRNNSPNSHGQGLGCFRVAN